MALSKVDYNSLNVTAAASKALKWNSSADGFETGDVAGAMVLLETQTASSDSTITFDSDIDSTYKEYIFKLINVHPSAADNNLQVNFRDGGSSYDATKTTSFFRSVHRENGTLGSINYIAGSDLAQSTAVQPLNVTLDAANDSCLVGQLHLYDPSNTTFVTHFLARTQEVLYETTSQEVYVGGYCNVTAAIDGVQFSMSSGNIDAGTFKMYGVT